MCSTMSLTQLMLKRLGNHPYKRSDLPKDKCYGEYGHVGTRSCQSVLPGTTRHRDRDVVVFDQSEEVKTVDAFPVQPSTRPLPPRSRFAKVSGLLRCSLPVPQPTSDATGVAPHMRGMGGEKTSAMPEGTARTNRRGRELDEGFGSGSRGRRPGPTRRQERWVWTALGPTARGAGTNSSIAQEPLDSQTLSTRCECCRAWLPWQCMQR